MIVTPQATIIYGGMLLVIGIVLATALLQYLWNVTLPQISNMKVITFRQAFRLLLIGALLASGGFVHFNWH